MDEPSLTSLFHDFREKDGKASKIRLRSVNITTPCDYRFYVDDRDRIVFQLDDDLYFVTESDTLYVDGKKVFINNRLAKPDESIYQDDLPPDIRMTQETEKPAKGDVNVIIDSPKIFTLPKNLPPVSHITLQGIRKPNDDDFWDKRKTKAIFRITDWRNHAFDVRIYRDSHIRSLKGACAYGGIDIYCPKDSYDEKEILKFIDYLVKGMEDQIYFDPFYDGETIVVLGKRKVISHQEEEKDNPDIYYIAPNQHPLEPYKKAFFLYLSKRIPEIGKDMGLDMSGWAIRIGDYRSIFACNYTGRHILCFDYRNLCFRKDYLDALITHELVHCYIHGHGKDFYQMANRYCEEYNYKDYCFSHGIFDDRDLSLEEEEYLAKELIEKHRLQGI